MERLNGTQTAKELTKRRRFYFIRDKDNRPVITVCIADTSLGYFRGVSICHPLDAPCKEKGKTKAAARADQSLIRFKNGKPGKPSTVKAMLTKRVSGMIGKVGFACNVRGQFQHWSAWVDEVMIAGELLLAAKTANLTPLERKLFGIKEEA